MKYLNKEKFSHKKTVHNSIDGFKSDMSRFEINYL